MTLVGGRGQYHQIIIWQRSDSGCYPWRVSRYWDGKEWGSTAILVTVESLYAGHTAWIAEQIQPTQRAQAPRRMAA